MDGYLFDQKIRDNAYERLKTWSRKVSKSERARNPNTVVGNGTTRYLKIWQKDAMLEELNEKWSELLHLKIEKEWKEKGDKHAARRGENIHYGD